MVGCPLAGFRLIGGLLFILLLGLFLTVAVWSLGLRSLFSVLPFWPASWLIVVDKGRGSKSVEVQRD